MEHKIKRIVQRLLFSKIEPGLTMRGLAGEEPLVYKDTHPMVTGLVHW